MADVEIEQDEQQQAFVATVDGAAVGRLDYRMVGSDTLDITHVGVDDAQRGNGIASRLTEAAFERARELNQRVVPSCPYAKVWIKRHDDYTDLLAS